MARPAQPQRSLRDPVTKPRKSLFKNSPFQLKRKQSERESNTPHLANRPLPSWAQEVIQEVTKALLFLSGDSDLLQARKGRKRSSSSGASRTLPDRD